MKLFSRKQQQPQPIIPPELQPYYNMQSHQKSMWRNRQVLLPAAVVLVALLIVGVVVWQIVAQTTKHNDTNGRSPESTQSPQSTNVPKTTGKPAQTSSSGKTNTAPVPDTAE